MRKVILTLGIALLSYKVGAQIVVKETLKDSVVWYNKMVGLPKLICFYGKEEASSYVMYFQNAKYTQIRDVQYLTLGDLGTAKEFFNILLKVADGSEDITIELDKSTWIISKSMGSISIWSNYESFYLTRKNVETILDHLNQVK